MSTRKSPALFCILAVLVVMVGLAILPDQLRKTTYSLATVGSQSHENEVFPLDKPFPVIRAPEAYRTRGQAVTLRQLVGATGAPLLINFWATWCPPCIEEFPSLEYLNRQLLALPKTEKAPLIVTISVDDKTNDVLNFFKTVDFVPSVIVLHDPQGEFSRSVGTLKFPESYLVSADGKILHKWVGPENWLSRGVIQKIQQLAVQSSH